MLISKERNGIRKVIRPSIHLAPEPDHLPDSHDTTDFSKPHGWLSPDGIYYGLGLPCGHELTALDIANDELGGYVSRNYSDTAGQYIEDHGWIKITDHKPLLPDKAWKTDTWNITNVQYAALCVIMQGAGLDPREELSCFEIVTYLKKK